MIIITLLHEAEETHTCMYFDPLVVTYTNEIQDVRQENSTVCKGTNFNVKQERQHVLGDQQRIGIVWMSGEQTNDISFCEAFQ